MKTRSPVALGMSAWGTISKTQQLGVMPCERVNDADSTRPMPVKVAYWMAAGVGINDPGEGREGSREGQERAVLAQVERHVGQPAAAQDDPAGAPRHRGE